MTILPDDPWAGKNLPPGPYESLQRSLAVARRARLWRRTAEPERPGKVVRTIVIKPPVSQIDPVTPAPYVYKPIVKSITSVVEVDSPFQWRHIVDEVCAKHNVSFADLCSQRRTAAFVAARFEACYRLGHETSMSLKQIGRRIGGKDHTTVLYGIRQHAKTLGVACR